VSRERARGTAWESEIVRALRAFGFIHAERRALNGANDLGDITGLGPRVVIEAKNAKTITLAGWLDEAETERANAGADIGVVWFKRRGRASAADGYVLMSGQQFMDMLGEVEL
jgi:hypothetical protein